MMKRHTRQFLEIGAFYLVVLIVVDRLLIGFPVLTWLALAVAFAIFSIFIIGTLFELIPRRAVKPMQPIRRDTDEMRDLERLTKNALEDQSPDSASLLSERVRLLAVSAAAYRLNISNAQLRDAIEHTPEVLETRLQDQEIAHALTSDDPLMSPRDARTLQSLLLKMENWLS
jgi:hypothetical protein